MCVCDTVVRGIAGSGSVVCCPAGCGGAVYGASWCGCAVCGVAGCGGKGPGAVDVNVLAGMCLLCAGSCDALLPLLTSLDMHSAISISFFLLSSVSWVGFLPFP